VPFFNCNCHEGPHSRNLGPQQKFSSRFSFPIRISSKYLDARGTCIEDLGHRAGHGLTQNHSPNAPKMMCFVRTTPIIGSDVLTCFLIHFMFSKLTALASGILTLDLHVPRPFAFWATLRSNARGPPEQTVPALSIPPPPSEGVETRRPVSIQNASHFFSTPSCSRGWIGVRRPCHSQALVNGLRGTPLSGATGASSGRSKSFRRTIGTPRGFYSAQRQPGYLMLISWDSTRALEISCCLQTLRSHCPVSQNDGNVLIIMVQFYRLMGGKKTLAQPSVRKARP